MKTDEEIWKQKEFERLYNVLSKNPRDKMPSYLPGLCEIQNTANGYDVRDEIVKIGNDKEVSKIGMQ